MQDKYSTAISILKGSPQILDRLFYLYDNGPAPWEKLASTILPKSARIAAKHKKLLEDVRYLQNSSLFDAAWYLDHHKDVSKASQDAATHFVFSGEEEGRMPLPDYKRDFDAMLQYQQRPFTGSYFVRCLQIFQEKLGHVETLGSKTAAPATLEVVSHGELGHLFDGDLVNPHTGPDKLEVLFIGHDASRSGAPVGLLGLIEYMVQHYPINARIALQLGGPLLEDFKNLGPVYLLSEINKRTGSIEDTADLLSTYFASLSGPKVVLANTTSVDSAFCLGFKKKDVPYFAWIHELPDCIEQHFGGREKMDLLSENSTALVFGGSFAYSENLSHFNLKKENARTIELGIKLQLDNADGQNAREQVRKEFNLSPDTQLVLGCGTIEQRKGSDLFVQVARTFFDLYPQQKGKVSFLWIGRPLSPMYLADIEADINKAGLRDSVRFAGERNNSHPYYKASDALLMTSRRDTRPLVALEAIGYSLPVIGFEGVTGIPEYTSQGYGSMVPFLDTRAMAEELQDYLLKKKSIKDDGAQFIAKVSDVSLFAEQFHQEFKQAIESHNFATKSN